MKVPVFDILNCGPRHRFVANGKLVHNSEGVNLQNLPSRGPNAKKLKKAIKAPEGYMLVDADSSQIEARVLAWLAEQDDLVDAFRNGDDVYKKMASSIYGIPETEVDKPQRQMGKTVILGCGYNMGSEKFKLSLKAQAGIDIDLDEAQRIITIYRSTNHKIYQLWKDAGASLRYMVRGQRLPFGRAGVIDIDLDTPGIILPNGLVIRYDGLQESPTDRGVEYTYNTRRGRTRLYGGKSVENLTQALARIVVGEQMLAIAKRYRVVLTVHDSVVCCVPEAEVDTAKEFIAACMKRAPAWAPDLPVDCEVGAGPDYGSTE